MNQDQAIQILTNVALLAQSKGILSLDDAAVVREAINIFKLHQPNTVETEKVPEPESEPTTE